MEEREIPRPHAILAGWVEPGSRVLEVGGGDGSLAGILREQGCHITGIEIDSEAAAAYRQVADEVRVGDVETMDLAGWLPFDVILLGDVLEHLKDPVGVLLRLRDLLQSDGRLLLSVPHVGHGSVRANLVCGLFPYGPRGLLDRTHLRFYTPATLEQDVNRAGFRIEEWESVQVPVAGGEIPLPPGLPPAVLRHIERDPSATIYQMVVRAVPYGGSVLRQAVDVVLVTFFSEETIDACLDSLLPTLGPQDRLYVIDNGSTDGTASRILERVRGDARCRLQENPLNLGFSAASNQGIRQGRNPFVVLLNPDTEVGSGWLEGLLERFAGEEVGAVGPVSDYVAGDQQAGLYVGVDRVPAVETRLLIGFCLMLRRSALERLGLLDEDLFLGHDDLDLSWRLREVGYRLLVAPEVFVHHLGHRSFYALPEMQERYLLAQSANFLYSKLREQARRRRIPMPDAESLWGVDWFTPTRHRTSIIIPCWDGVELTRQCVESILRHTRLPIELVLIDNGSADGTGAYLAFLQETLDLPVRRIRNAENQGYARAVNAGLARAEGDLFLILNNDVVVTPGWLERLTAALEAQSGVGLAGPHAPHVSGVQGVDGMSPTSIPDLDRLSREWAIRQAGHVRMVRRLVGFCLLVKREVVDRIGVLDERFGLGNYEDDDYCLRAQLAGYRLALVGDVLIHHYGGVSFATHSLDYEALLQHNRETLMEKWGLPPNGTLDQVYRRVLGEEQNTGNSPVGL